MIDGQSQPLPKAMKRGISTGLGGAASGSAVGRSRVPQVGDAVECETSADFSWQLRWLPGSVTWVDAKTKKMSVLVRRALKDDRVVLSSDEEYKVRVHCLTANAVCPRAFAPCARAERGQRAFGAAARG